MTTYDLTDDGDTADISDGRTLRLRIEPDHTDPFDNDFYGRIAPAPDRPYDRHGMRTNHRPADFDGNAEKLWLQQNQGAVWWQPPPDVARDSEGFATLRDAVNDLASFGHIGIVLEVLDGTDAYGRPIVADVASLWGIEPFPEAAYVAEVVADLATELGLDAGVKA